MVFLKSSPTTESKNNKIKQNESKIIEKMKQN